jgi:hypothetical protein
MTRRSTEPLVTPIMMNAARPIRTTPFIVTSRSLRFANRVGNHRSRAMFASTRGPSRNPVCAAMMRSAASENRVTMTKPVPVEWPHPTVIRSKSTALSVLPLLIWTS